MDVERNVAQATEDITNVFNENNATDVNALAQIVTAPAATRADFAAYFSKWKNLKVLIGTSYSWFALDVSPNSALLRS